VKSCRELNAWQRSDGLAVAVYEETRAFPRAEVFGLTSQLRRASVSIPANIAEGYCRHTRADYLRFLSIAQGSVGELGTLLSLAHDLSCLDAGKQLQLAGRLEEVSKLLTGLARSLRSTARRPDTPAPVPWPLNPEPERTDNANGSTFRAARDL
jgi:four helix bundle protein